MAKSTKGRKKPAGKSKKAGTSSKRKAASRSSSTEKRVVSRAVAVRQISRKLEKEEQRAQSASKAAVTLAKQLERLKEKCPHKRLELNRVTGMTICRDCLSVVGVQPVTDEQQQSSRRNPFALRSSSAEDAEGYGHDLADKGDDDLIPFQPTSDDEMDR